MPVWRNATFSELCVYPKLLSSRKVAEIHYFRLVIHLTNCQRR